MTQIYFTGRGIKLAAVQVTRETFGREELCAVVVFTETEKKRETQVQL